MKRLVPDSVPFWVYALVGIAGGVVIFLGGREAANTIERNIYRDVTIQVEEDQKQLHRRQLERLRRVGDEAVREARRELRERTTSPPPTTSAPQRQVTPNGGTSPVPPSGSNPAPAPQQQPQQPSQPSPIPRAPPRPPQLLPVPDVPNVCVLIVCVSQDLTPPVG